MRDAYGLPPGGQRLVVADRAGRLTGREIVIPGLRGDPDALPRFPSIWDDEFDGPLGTQWVPYGSGVSLSTSAVKSHLLISANNTGGSVHGHFGVAKACPPFPFTMIAKLASFNGVCDAAAGSNWAYSMVGVATPGAFVTQGPFNISSTTSPIMYRWTNPTTGNAAHYTGPTTGGYGFGAPLYLKMVVTSSTAIQGYFGVRGIGWIPMAASLNPGITIGSVGLGINPAVSTTGLVIAAFDFIRFTTP